jgi:glyoxylate/hydroxypyruvate reductase
MSKGALALLIHGGTDNWSPERWNARFNEVCPDRRVLQLPAAGFDPAEVHYAAVWKPVPGELAGFPNLKVIFNLGAGVDALMADKTLPDVPLVRVSVADLTDRMAEYVVLHVLMHHRQEPYLRESQRVKRWAPKSQWPASAISVGIMGLGVLGANAADILLRIGFKVIVCLLPLTPETRHILNRGLFAKLNRNSLLGAPVLINAGRGGLQNEADILACLDDGTLGATSLDVYAQEPLPADSPFWTHPKVVLTPHNAADTDPDEISKYVARQIERFEADGPLDNVVDRTRGY